MFHDLKTGANVGKGSGFIGISSKQILKDRKIADNLRLNDNEIFGV